MDELQVVWHVGVLPAPKQIIRAHVLLLASRGSGTSHFTLQSADSGLSSTNGGRVEAESDTSNKYTSYSAEVMILLLPLRGDGGRFRKLKVWILLLNPNLI